MPRKQATPASSISVCAAFCAAFSAGIIIAISLSGCAAPLKIAASADPLAVLERGSLVYARLSGEAASELASSSLSAAQAKALLPVLKRTRLVALGLGSLTAADGSKAPNFQACLIGDYPFRAAAMSLGADPSWKREKNGYFNAVLGLHAALPGLAHPCGTRDPRRARTRHLDTRAVFGARGHIPRRGDGYSRARHPHHGLSPGAQ